MESRKRASHIKNSLKRNPEETLSRDAIIANMKKNASYDSKEASELLNISIQSLRRSIAIGKIKTVRIGRYLRIPAEEIQKLSRGDSTLLNVQEASDLLNISEYMIRSLIKAGKIDAFRLTNSGPFKIPKSEIDRISREGIKE